MLGGKPGAIVGGRDEMRRDEERKKRAGRRAVIARGWVSGEVIIDEVSSLLCSALLAVGRPISNHPDAARAGGLFQPLGLVSELYCMIGGSLEGAGAVVIVITVLNSGGEQRRRTVMV